jgi:hypothetical protein
MGAGGEVVLDFHTVDLAWPEIHRRHLDGAFGGHTLKRAEDVLTCLTKVADGKKECPRALWELFKLRGPRGEHYRSMFGAAFFSQAREFVRGLRNRFRELERVTHGIVQRYTNRQRPFWKFVPRLRCRRALHPA